MYVVRKRILKCFIMHKSYISNGMTKVKSIVLTLKPKKKNETFFLKSLGFPK